MGWFFFFKLVYFYYRGCPTTGLALGKSESSERGVLGVKSAVPRVVRSTSCRDLSLRF